MSRVEQLIARAAREVLPTSEEERKIGALAGRIMELTKRASQRHREVKDVVLGGSYAKGTWLSGHVDLDLFIRIDPSTSEKRFEEVGLAIGEEATKGYPRGKKYAQHPYTEATVGETRVNIVPCYAVEKGKWRSAADRSPYHVDVVRGLPHRTKTEIRVLKKFMLGTGVYGAEIETQGFSGYAAEVLVIAHGDCEGVIRWFADSARPGDARPFSLPDPVDERRDLGLAVSGESLARMVMACREFLRRPSRAYFARMSGKKRPSLRSSVYAVTFSHEKLSEDTLWGELRKTTKHLVRHLEVAGFRVARSIAASNNSDRSAILLIAEIESLPPLEQRIGPTVDRQEDLHAFLKSNGPRSKLVWVDSDARVRLLLPREYVHIESILQDLAKGSTGSVGASRELERGMKKSAKILSGKALVGATRRATWLGEGVKEITTDVLGTS